MLNGKRKKNDKREVGENSEDSRQKTTPRNKEDTRRKGEINKQKI